jgi:hypothetical protein
MFIVSDLQLADDAESIHGSYQTSSFRHVACVLVRLASFVRVSWS